jgi:hypothetical protein
MYTKPFTVKIPHELLADADVFEISAKTKSNCWCYHRTSGYRRGMSAICDRSQCLALAATDRCPVFLEMDSVAMVFLLDAVGIWRLGTTASLYR